MKDWRWTFPVVVLLFTACSGVRLAGPEPPEPADEGMAGSAGLEEAGLEAGLPEEFVVPGVELEELPTPRTPGGFLYPPGEGLPEPIQRQVEQFIHAFAEGRASETYRVWLEREAVWGDWVRGQLRSAGLPEDLVYLAMIESGFHPTAVSHAGATGMWQFMPATARLSGLRVDDWVDERRDPAAATRAAIRHLGELYEATGDWALAAAAYNAGLRRVTRAQARSDADDYFSLSLARRLPRETRNYVPIMLAAAWLDAHRPAYDLPPREPGVPPVADSLTAEGRTRLSVLASALAVPAETLKELNPHLVRGAVPPPGGYVRVPVGTDTVGLGDQLAGLTREQRLLPDWLETRYTVRSGDSWWVIARRHDTTVDRLRRLNPRKGDVIYPGDRLVVRRVAAYDRPGRAVAATAPARTTEPAAPARSPMPVPPPRGNEAYTVKAGDTMSEIAAELGVPLATLVEWNGMATPRLLRI
ncbi:MAG TPA: transglycosylase SLT domain-containing protein, partial [Longimicrobiales bacterium]|nr:transglycosylase SLT domain-containing protein [Longimicrobiales bacterium]